MDSDLAKTDKPRLALGRQRIVWWWSTRAIPHLERRIKHAFKELVIKCEAWGLERWILLERLLCGLPFSKLLGLEPAREDQGDRKANLFPCDVEDFKKKKTNYTEWGMTGWTIMCKCKESIRQLGHFKKGAAHLQKHHFSYTLLNANWKEKIAMTWYLLKFAYL